MYIHYLNILGFWNCGFNGVLRAWFYDDWDEDVEYLVSTV